MGPRAVWTARKISPLPGFDPRTVQLVASRYTDYVIPALHFKRGTSCKGSSTMRRFCAEERIPCSPASIKTDFTVLTGYQNFVSFT